MTKLHLNTPLIESLAIGRPLNTRIWLKMDNMQPCGSFKARGVGYACGQHKANGIKKLISSSGGNAGLAVAYCGRQLGMDVTVVVPETTKRRAIELMEQEGAQVIVTGQYWDLAHLHAMELVDENSAYIHPFDDPLLWQGHSSVIDEIVASGVKPDAVILSVGGGGLLAGVVAGLKRHGLHDTKLIAVETQGAESLAAAKMAQKHIAIDGISSLATSLGATKVAEHTFELLQRHPIDCHVVQDKQAIDACYRFLQDHRSLVEPACGASLSIVYDSDVELQQYENVVVIVCGGVNTTLDQLQKWHQQLY